MGSVSSIKLVLKKWSFKNVENWPRGGFVSASAKKLFFPGISHF